MHSSGEHQAQRGGDGSAVLVMAEQLLEAAEHTSWATSATPATPATGPPCLRRSRSWLTLASHSPAGPHTKAPSASSLAMEASCSSSGTGAGCAGLQG